MTLTHSLLVPASYGFVAMVLVWAVEARFEMAFIDAVRVLFS